jgi:hypothetical protein
MSAAEKEAQARSSSSGKELLSVSFNQDGGCFSVGTSSGFRIFNVSPFQETVWRSFQRGGIGTVEMLYRSNLIAVVGGGQTPRYPRNKVFIWDDHQGRNVGELAFEHHVKAVRLRRDKIVVVLKYKTYVYRFNDLKLMDQITTLANDRGLVSLCPDPGHAVLALPGLTKGSIRVELYDLRKAYLINAHETDLSCFALNHDGSRICSASEKGTLIRVWDCYTGDQIKELRRGADRAEIFCLAFNWNNTFLACSSDKGTIHIFSLVEGDGGDEDGVYDTTLQDPPSIFGAIADTSDTQQRHEGQDGAQSPDPRKDQSAVSLKVTSPTPPAGSAAVPDDQQEDASNIRSGLAFMRGMLPGLVPKYFGSEWSYAQIRGLESRSICAFDPDPEKVTLNIVGGDGFFSVYSFKERGECKRLSSKKFMG